MMDGFDDDVEALGKFYNFERHEPVSSRDLQTTTNRENQDVLLKFLACELQKYLYKPAHVLCTNGDSGCQFE